MSDKNPSQDSIDNIFKETLAKAKEEQKNQVDQKNIQSEEPSVIVEDEPNEKITVVDEENQQQQEQIPVHEDENQKYIERGKKYSSIQRQKNKLAAELKERDEYIQRLAYENELLKTQQTTSSNASLLHYENSIKLQQANLKESLKKANDIQDMDMVADIQLELGRLGAEINAINTHKAQELAAQQYYQQQQYQQPYQPTHQNPYESYPQQSPPQEYDLNDDTREWVNKNAWFVPGSKGFNEDLHNEAMDYATMLDRKYMREGRQDELMTSSYYQDIDNHMRKFMGNSQNNLSMNKPSSQVAPVRRSGSGTYSSPTRVTLTQAEKNLAKRLGITNEQYAASKVEMNKEFQNALDTGDKTYLAHHTGNQSYMY